MITKNELEALTFSPNGCYMLVVEKGKEHLYHLSIPWDIPSYTHELMGVELENAIKRLLKRSWI